MAQVKTTEIQKYLNSPESGEWRKLCGFGPNTEVNVDHIHARSWGGDDSLFNFVLVEAVVNRYWDQYAAIDKSHKRHGALGWQKCARDVRRPVPQKGRERHLVPHRPAFPLLLSHELDRRDGLAHRARLHGADHGRGPRHARRRCGDAGLGVLFRSVGE